MVEIKVLLLFDIIDYNRFESATKKYILYFSVFLYTEKDFTVENYDRVPSEIRPVQEGTTKNLVDNSDGEYDRVTASQKKPPPPSSTNNYDTVWNNAVDKDDVVKTDDDLPQENSSYVNIQCAGQGKAVLPSAI